MISSPARILKILFLILMTSATALSQIAGGMDGTNTQWGGNNFIVGTVFGPSGKRVDTKIRIRLSSLARSEIISMTDDTGRFVFTRLPSGTYSVIIDEEPDYESISQSVEIFQGRDPSPQSYAVTIRLVAKVKPGFRPGVLRAENAGVSKAALDHYAKAQKFIAESDLKAAVAQLKLAIAAHPAFLDAFNELGVLYMRLNELDKAVEALDGALKIKPDAFEPLLNRGITLFRMKRYPEAEAALREVLVKHSSSPIAHFYLGRTFMSGKKYAEAEKELKAALDADANLHEAHRMLAMLYLDTDDRRRAASALETYLRLVPTAPDADQLRKALGQIKAAIGKP